jgi:hypothetical protein
MEMLRLLTLNAAHVCLGMALVFTIIDYPAHRVHIYSDRSDGCLTQFFTALMLAASLIFLLVANSI